jgi:hypothetical protein
MFNTPINNSINKSNNNNDFPIKKTNKSNHNQKNFSRIKNDKINLSLTKINYNIEDNTSNNNNSYTYNALSRINNENLLIEKKMEKKLSCTKSFNHLKRNLNNENIKSLFISNVKNNIKKLNSNSLNSEKNTSKKNNLYIETKIRGYFNINKKKSCTNKFHTFQNSPLNTFNNNFKCANFNQNKKVNNNSKEKNNFNMYSNNNSYNTNYSNKI